MAVMPIRGRASVIAGIVAAAALAAGWTLRARPPAPAAPAHPADPSPRAASAGFGATVPNPGGPQGQAPAGMVWIPGGESSMGTLDPRHLEHGGHEAMD